MEIAKLKSDENQKTSLRSVMHRKYVLIMVLVLVASLAFAGFAWAQKDVTLVVDGKKQVARTYVSTVQDLINEEELKLSPKDRVIPGPDTALKDGLKIVIRRAVPLNILVDNQRLELVTSAATIKEAIQEQNIKLNKLDQVIPGLNTNVEPNMEIKISRIEQKLEKREVPIAFATINKQNSNLARGTTKEERPGKNGTEKQIWQITYRDGKEINSQILEREIVSNPVDRIVQVGTQQAISRGGLNFRYSNVMYMVASAYTYTGNNTASGVPPRVGVVAVDPGVIPIGTRLYVEGYGYATALDKGGAIKGNRIDLFMSSMQHCNNWGIRKVKVFLLQ